MASRCGGLSETEYTSADDDRFVRQLCSIDVGPEWCTEQVHQVETRDRGTVRRTDPAVQVWTSGNFTDRYTLEEARALGASLLAAADRLEVAQAEHEALVEEI